MSMVLKLACASESSKEQYLKQSPWSYPGQSDLAKKYDVRQQLSNVLFSGHLGILTNHEGPQKFVVIWVISIYIYYIILEI